MVPDALGALCEVNKNLRLTMLRLRPERTHISTLSPRDFLDLRNQMLRAGNCLRGLPRIAEATDEVRKELIEYQANLRKLHQFLPDVHGRLLAEKSRLSAARTHTAAASHWAQAGADHSLYPK
jgi:hypothetical protein